MTDLRVIPWIRDLDEARAVALARSLIYAEAGRLGLPYTAFSMSGRVKARDQGVDGRTHFPPDSSALHPVGPQVWQVKSGASPPDASKEFDPKHTALLEAIRQGYDYTLFWTNDPVDPTATTVKENFRDKVRDIRPDADANFIFADAIESLCYAHLAVLSQSHALPLGGVVSLATWGQRKDFGIPFSFDELRRRHAEALHTHVRSEDPASSTLHLYGDTGVGKSRLVFEALNQETIVERVLVALDPSYLDRNLLTLVAASPKRHLILVVDDCTAEDRRDVARYADLAQGRIRLVTAGSRYSRDRQLTDARYLEVSPLEAAASREIALSIGLSEADAHIVAHYTEGYPKLAFVLADAISNQGAAESLLERIRSESVGSVLSSMLTNTQDIDHLGCLALFEKLGYEEDLAQETTIACEILGIDETAFRDVIDRELNRFVSDAGRYRLVTPRLFAVWLAAKFIERHGNLAQALDQLPESLRDRVTEQMKAFAGDKYVGRALGQILHQAPFTTGVLADVDEGSARLLHVAAIIDPALAMNVIESTMANHPTEALQTGLAEGRRGFVNALEVLIWFDENFERAATALLRLALAENETWSNNATGVIQGIFRVHLGGTSAPYQRRLTWARHALRESAGADSLLASGLANAFLPHEMRHSPEFASRSTPPEWRPHATTEEVAARRGAWQLLMELARAGRSVNDVAIALAGGLSIAMAHGLSEEVLTDLTTVDWPPAARAKLEQAVERIRKYGNLSSETVTRLEELQARLVGSTREDQLSFLLSQSPWQLYERGDANKPSPLLTQVAAQLAGSGPSEILDAARRSRIGDFQTAVMLFERIAMVRYDTDVQSALESDSPLPEAAVLGMLVGFTKTLGEDWALTQLGRWLQNDLKRLVVQAAHMLPPSDKLAELVIQAVRDGRSDSRELGRFLYGAWARDLRADNVASVIGLLGGIAQANANEQALGILSQWLERHSGQDIPELDRIAIDLLKASTDTSNRRSSMVSLYRQRVLTQLKVPIDTQLDVMSDVLYHLDYPLSEYDLELISSLARRDPGRTIAAVIFVIIGEPGRGFVPGVLWLESSKILSYLASACSADDVIREIERVPSDRWRELVSHVSFSEPGPNSLIETLILRSSDEVVRARAAFSFMYPESAYRGNESDYLRERRVVAVSWLKDATSPGIKEWLREVIEELDARIASAVRSEAEESS